MCVAVVAQPGKQLDNDRLFRGWTANPDGAGFAYADQNGVVIRKGFLQYNPFQKAYEEAFEKHGASSPFLIHMRIRTSGNINSDNCHPFRIKNGAMIHNGIMFTPDDDDKQDKKDRKSDTRIFAESFHNILDLESVRKAESGILDAIGHSNKLAFLYNDKTFFIMNSRAGYWDNGIWYSNSSCAVGGRR